MLCHSPAVAYKQISSCWQTRWSSAVSSPRQTLSVPQMSALPSWPSLGCRGDLGESVYWWNNYENLHIFIPQNIPHDLPIQSIAFTIFYILSKFTTRRRQSVLYCNECSQTPIGCILLSLSMKVSDLPGPEASLLFVNWGSFTSASAEDDNNMINTYTVHSIEYNAMY